MRIVTGIIEHVGDDMIRVGDFDGPLHRAVVDYAYAAWRRLERVECVVREGVVVRIGRVDGEVTELASVGRW